MQTTHWQKSSYSGDSSNCVEIAAAPTTIRIRDSKNLDGPRLAVAHATWASFVSYAGGPGADF